MTKRETKITPDVESSNVETLEPIDWRTTDGGLLRGRGRGFGPYMKSFLPEQRTLLHVLERQAQVHPDKPWLIFDGSVELSFGEAFTRSARFSSSLSRTGFTPTKVALLLRNDVAFMPVFYGSMMHRSVAAALNPELRGPMLKDALRLCEAEVLVTHVGHVDRIADFAAPDCLRLILTAGEPSVSSVNGIPVRALDAWVGENAGDFILPGPEELPGSHETAAILMTSGTTGGSKAVLCSHSYLYMFSAGVADSLQHTSGDVLTTPLALCHVAALGVIANAALHVGCSAHLKSTFSATEFWTQVAADGATFCMLIGQMAEMILNSAEAAPEHRLAYTYLIPKPANFKEFEERFRTRLIWQGSGLTEVFPHPPSKKQIEGVPASTIGHPSNWFDYGVVDENDRLLPPGTEGELVYRSRVPFGMFDGYYKDPEATVKALRNFVFHTGDLAYYDEFGRVNYLRRTSDTVRRAGENISCTEFENVALQYPGILEVAAYGVPDGHLGEAVKFDFVATEVLDLAKLYMWLSENLPRYMVPTYLEQKDSMPKTPSQKIEKHKLKLLPLDREAVARFKPPRRSEGG